MGSVLDFTIRTIQILLLNLVLSGDNIGVIALATRNLPKEFARKASMIGISVAIILRIIFACMVVWILEIQWLPIKLVGGLLLVKITWDFIKPQEEEQHVNVKQSDKFMVAVVSIIIADLTMSLDNVLAIASAAKDNMILMVFGLLLSIPVLFFGSQFVVELMKKYLIVVYIGGAILAHTAFNMIMEDSFVAKYSSHALSLILPLAAGVSVILYGIYEIRRSDKPEGAEIMEAAAAAEENREL